MAIDNTTVVPKLVAAALLRQYYNSRVYAARVNNTWRNQLNAYGDTVIINRPAEASIGDYTKQDITYAAADVGSPLELSMDKTKMWAIQFDDLDRAVSRIDLLQESTREYGVKLAEVVDADVRNVMLGNRQKTGGKGTGIDPVDMTDHLKSLDVWKSGGVASKVPDSIGTEDLGLDVIHRIMDVQNIPTQGRWAVVNPYFAQVVRRIALKSDRILTSPSTAIGRVVDNGLMGEFAGFRWYVDSGNHATITASGSAANKVASAKQTMLFGVDSATAFIDQIRKTERLRLQTRFSDAVRGLYKYGADVVYERRLFTADFTMTGIPYVATKLDVTTGPMQSTGTSPAVPAD